MHPEIDQGRKKSANWSIILSMKLDVESKMDFDYSVNTEDRFALRNWFNQMVKEINYNDPGAYLPKLSQTLHVEGFTDEPMEHDDYVAFLARRAGDGHVRMISYPELTVSARFNRFSLKGTFEEVVDGVLAAEGTIETVVGKEDGEFRLWWQMFYPRLRVQESVEPAVTEPALVGNDNLGEDNIGNDRDDDIAHGHETSDV